MYTKVKVVFEGENHRASSGRTKQITLTKGEVSWIRVETCVGDSGASSIPAVDGCAQSAALGIGDSGNGSISECECGKNGILEVVAVVRFFSLPESTTFNLLHDRT
jgi:hypothetical protein